MTRSGYFALGGAWLASVLAFGFALERPTPLFLNLGAGDDPFVRGFRGGWERDGLHQDGETMFRWTLDGALLDFPVSILSGQLTAQLRLARFLRTPVKVTLLASGRRIDEWTQKHRSWLVRGFDLDDTRGPLTLQFRSTSENGDEMGLALDWVEIDGAQWVLPRPRYALGLLALSLLIPLFVTALLRSALLGALAGTLLTLAAAVGTYFDRFGGLVAASQAGFAGLLLVVFFALIARVLARFWPEQVPLRASAVPLLGALGVLLALSHPFFYYPDIDTHAQYLETIREHHSEIWDSSEYQSRTGAWTREIGGKRVAFPYSPVFHIFAWPFAVLVGNVAAIKVLAVLAVALSLLLVYGLALSLGLGSGGAVMAQGVFLFLPVLSSRLSLALFPALLGQALELLLALHLVRRFSRIDSVRDVGIAFLFLTLAQSAYTGSILSVGAVLGTFVALELAVGDRRRASRLLAAYVISALLVIGVCYGRFLPHFLSEVLPHAREANAKELVLGEGPAGLAWGRVSYFYDFVCPALLLTGLLAWRAYPIDARKVTRALLLGGALLLVLRFLAPAVFRDAKDVELLASPFAVLCAAGLGWIGGRGWAGRLVSFGGALYLAGWGLLRAWEVYSERFFALR